MRVRNTVLVLALLLLVAPSLPVSHAASPPDLQAPTQAPASAPGPWLPNPVSYSALGDSITPAFDANGSLANAGIQPYYSYAVGWNTSVFSLWKHLERIYGPNSVTPHLLAVPGDKAIDMVWQAALAVQNHSGFVTVLIGGNDLCHHSGSYPNEVLSPTPVANFSESLNRTFHILRTQLPPTTVIALANVVNVSHLAVLFAGNSQADTVYAQTCPALLNATGRSLLTSMDIAYNRAEVGISRTYGLSTWNISALDFPASDVNTLDYFHPSVAGQGMLATAFWATLPYASMLPRISVPSFPPTVAAGGDLALSTAVLDALPTTVNVSYLPPGTTSWSTLPMSLQAGNPYNGTFACTLPLAATASVGTLDLYFEAGDNTGHASTLPAGAPESFFQINITASSSVPSITSFQAEPPSITLGGNVTMIGDVTGGIGYLSYAYQGLPAGCLTVNASSLTCQPLATGTFRLLWTVTDAQGHWASATAPLDVNPSVAGFPMITSFSATPVAVPLGTGTVFSVNVSGGVPPYSYSYRGLPTGCLSADSPSLACTPTAPGNFTTTVIVTDHLGNSATSTLSLQGYQVSPPPLAIFSFAILPSTPSLGESLTLNVTTTGGTSPLGYAYSGLPPGCATSDTAVLVCRPSSTGTYTVTVIVTDAAGRVAVQSATLVVGGVTTPEVLPMEWVWTLPLLFLVAAIPIAYHFRRRGRRRRTAPGLPLDPPAPPPTLWNGPP